MIAAEVPEVLPLAVSCAGPNRAWRPVVLDRAFDLQLRFNLFPATYAHASWVARISRNYSQASGLDEYCDSPFWLRRLSVSLLRARKLEQDVDFDFSDRAKRIALLDAAVLERSARLMAGLLVRERIKHVVLGAEMTAIEQTLGRETHRSVLGWTAPLPKLSFTFQQRDEPFPDRERWTRRAVRLVSALLPDAAAGTLARMQFKFPYDWTKFKLPVLSDEDRKNLTELFIAVLKKAEPDHARLFIASSVDAAPERNAPC